MTNRLSLSCAPRGHGSLVLTLLHDGVPRELHIVDRVPESLSQLARAALQLWRGAPNARVTWHLSEGPSNWLLRQDAGSLELCMTAADSIRVPLVAFASAVDTALRTTEPGSPATAREALTRALHAGATPPARQLQVERRAPSGPGVRAILESHWRFTSSHSPQGCVHALDLSGLQRAEVTFWTIAEGEELLGCGALQELDPRHGEIKSMHVLERARGRGLAGIVLRELIHEARSRGYRRVSLETGRSEGFAPARRLYHLHGFEECPPFADYSEDPFSQCMTREL